MQDMEETVLQNINRPSIPKQEYVNLINRIKAELTESEFANLYIQLILGLPGQSVDSLKTNIVEAISNTGLSRFRAYPWYFLVNSPAADVLYQKMHRLKFDAVYHISYSQITCRLEDLYQQAASGDKNHKHFYSSNIIVQNKDMDWWDLQTIYYLYVLINDTPNYIFRNKSYEQISELVERLYRVSEKRLERQREIHQPLTDQYNVRFIGHYNL